MSNGVSAFQFRLKLLKKLSAIRLLSLSGLARLVAAAVTEGINLMLLLKWAAATHGPRTALVDERETLSFTELYRRSRQLAHVFQTDYKLGTRQKVALICRNHASLVATLFAVSRLGADVFLLNPEIGEIQFRGLVERHDFTLIVYDAEAAGLITANGLEARSIPAYGDHNASIESLVHTADGVPPKLKRGGSGNIVVMTGGTTGEPKAARRKPSLSNFLNPFFALLVKLDLDFYERAYIMTPAYHGFGLAAVFLALLLGMRTYFLTKFDARRACELIETEQIEVVTLVPLMLHRMLDQDARALGSLQRIITGGAPISPKLVERTLESLGDKIFNLYGTSEAGFSIMAIPTDLRRHSNTIGRKINGVKLKIQGANRNELPPLVIGRIVIKSSWSIGGSSGWVDTGDLGYRDADGFYFHCGRADEMVVSGGEKVYPIELETILTKHPKIEQAAVIGIADPEFGQRLKAFVVPKAASHIGEHEILDWLAGRAARFQMPKTVVIRTDLPVTPIGKINKKVLS